MEILTVGIGVVLFPASQPWKKRPDPGKDQDNPAQGDGDPRRGKPCRLPPKKKASVTRDGGDQRHQEPGLPGMIVPLRP